MKQLFRITLLAGLLAYGCTPKPKPVDVWLNMPFSELQHGLVAAGYTVHLNVGDIDSIRFAVARLRLPHIDKPGNASFSFTNQRLTSFIWVCENPLSDSHVSNYPDIHDSSQVIEWGISRYGRPSDSITLFSHDSTMSTRVMRWGDTNKESDSLLSISLFKNDTAAVLNLYNHFPSRNEFYN